MIGQGWNVIALDFSSSAVTLCRKAIPDHLHGQVIIADARWSPFKSATFDAIFAIHVIAHLYAPDRNYITHEIIRLLRPGGMLFLCEFSTDDFRFGKGHEVEEATFRRGTGIITHYFSEEEVSGLFFGLIPVSITKHQWYIKVRGCSLVRSEIQGIFRR
jgi:ubiquinone/menaquinone biosynthesis C-methylase UbiE